MSGFIRTLEKRILKKQGFHRHKPTGTIVNLDGDDFGAHYPRLTVKKEVK